MRFVFGDLVGRGYEAIVASDTLKRFGYLYTGKNNIYRSIKTNMVCFSSTGGWLFLRAKPLGLCWVMQGFLVSSSLTLPATGI